VSQNIEVGPFTYEPWNTNVGVDDPGQMRSFTWNYGSGSRRAFNSSV